MNSKLVLPRNLLHLCALPLCCAVLFSSACIPSLKSVFADASYPENIEPLPARDLELSVDASVFPKLVVGYDGPRQASACLWRLSQDADVLEAMWRYGGCVATPRPMAECLPHLPWIDASRGAEHRQLSGCVATLTVAADRVRLLHALSEAASGLYAYHLSLGGQGAFGRAMPAALKQGLRVSMEHAARVLDKDPRERHDAQLPALALSGGAANGAFVAGYLYALLWTRERALANANLGARALIQEYRFGSVFGSSVGTLVALPLDLYFSDARPNPEQERALTACVKSGSVTSRLARERNLQACALTKLETDFVRSESELLCAQPGDVLQFLHPQIKSLLRFDPLAKNVLEPFFRSFASILLENAFTRTVMAVDMQQNLLVGLDERACRMQGMNVRKCLLEPVLASISEPVFVPAREYVYSGLRGARGEKGTWLDGSIRSLNPAANAARFTTGKVLAINTTRAEGLPARPPKGALPLVLGTLDALGAASRSWEIAYARAFQVHRDRQLCELGTNIDNDSLCPSATVPLVPNRTSAVSDSLELGAGLLSVWVPEDVSPAPLFASGYTFDPIVMRGLFLWGQKEFFRSRARVFEWLGWCAISALERAVPGCRANDRSLSYVRELEAQIARVEQELLGYRRYGDPVLWQRHVDERRDLVKRSMSTCH